jgi:hypothetical protein
MQQIKLGAHDDFGESHTVDERDEFQIETHSFKMQAYAIRKSK